MSEPIISGVEEAQAEIAKLTEALANFPAIAAGEMGKALEKALLFLQGKAAAYPPSLPGSSYRRTGTLGRLWTSALRVVEARGSEVTGRVGNATPYGPYVQDPKRQAAIHRGRWRTTDEIVAKHEAEINAILAEAGGAMVQRIAEEAGS